MASPNQPDLITALPGTRVLPVPELDDSGTALGVGRAFAGNYLALSNVVCSSGSWLAPKPLIEDRDWRAIENLAYPASAL